MQPPEGPPVCAALNFLPFGMPPPISSTMVAQGGAHGDFDKAGVVDLAAQGEDLGALALLGAHGGEPLRRPSG